MSACYFFVTFTSALLRVVGVARATAGRAEAGVTADRVVAPLRTQTVVVVQQAFVNIYVSLCEGTESSLKRMPISSEMHGSNAENVEMLCRTFAELSGCVETVADCTTADVAAHSVLTLLVASTRIRVICAFVNIYNQISVRQESIFVYKMFHQFTDTTTAVVTKDVASRTTGRSGWWPIRADRSWCRRRRQRIGCN